MEELRKLNFYCPTSELHHHRETLEAEFKANPPKTAPAAIEQIEQLTGIRRGPTQVRKFLKALGRKRLKVGPSPAKADPDQQRVFLEEKLQPRLAESRQGKRHVFFVDAAHFVWQPFVGFLWCFTRVFIQAPSGRQRFNVLAALHATSRQIITITNDSYINAQSVVALLRKLARTFSDLPVRLVLDNARYQRCRLSRELAAELGIELLFLPPYSPNLNLIERLWKFIKKECLYSKCYATFANFKQAITDCIADTQVKYKQALTSLLTLKFQTFENATL